MIQRRLRRLTLVLGVVGLFLFMPTRAWAFCEALSSDSWQYEGFVWAEHYVVFDPSISFPEGYQCGYAEWEGWMVFYDIQTEIHTPTQMVEIGYGSGQNGAYSNAYVSIAAGGYGTYTIKGSGYETWVGNGYYQGTFVYSDRIEHVSAPPSAPWVTLYAANYSPPQNSGPVLVWAYLDGEGYPSQVSWDGCLPASALECYVDTSTAGTKTVTWWGLFGDISRFASTAIEVVPSGSGYSSVSGAVFIDYNGNGVFDEGDDPMVETTVYLTDQADTTVYGTSVTSSVGTYQFDELPAGGYRVKHPVPDGYVKTTDDSVPFNVPPNLNHNFGLQPAVACEVPFLPYKGLGRGRTVLYGFTGQNIPNEQPFVDAFSSWTSRNASAGVNVTYVRGETSHLSGIVVARGDAGFTDGLANYGSFDPTVSAGRVLGGKLVVSDRTDRVTTGEGFRRITQHELGHAHGLDHWQNVPQKISVMRAPNSMNGAALADYVTPCDALRAFQREDN